MSNFEDTMIIKNNNCEIKNSELKKYIQFRLGKENFEFEDLAQIDEIIIDGKNMIGEENVVYFDEIELFTNLKEIIINNLNISEQEIRKITPISKVTFKKCSIKTLKPLINVKKLSLKSSEINNIQEIKELKQIEELELVNLEIKDFNFLKELKKLNTLKIKNIKDFELDKITFCTQLEYLSVENIESLTYEDINKFTNLKYLSVDRDEANNLKTELEKIVKKGIEIFLNDIYKY